MNKSAMVWASIALGVIALILLFLNNILVSMNNRATGRFQLQPGTIEAINMDSGYKTKESHMFKIDTQTGETWEYNSTLGKEPYSTQQFWFPIGFKNR